jgi:hypothetical protein
MDHIFEGPEGESPDVRTNLSSWRINNDNILVLMTKKGPVSPGLLSRQIYDSPGSKPTSLLMGRLLEDNKTLAIQA